MSRVAVALNAGGDTAVCELASKKQALEAHLKDLESQEKEIEKQKNCAKQELADLTARLQREQERAFQEHVEHATRGTPRGG